MEIKRPFLCSIHSRQLVISATARIAGHRPIKHDQRRIRHITFDIEDSTQTSRRPLFSSGFLLSHDLTARVSMAGLKASIEVRRCGVLLLEPHAQWISYDVGDAERTRTQATPGENLSSHRSVQVSRSLLPCHVSRQRYGLDG